MDNETRRFWTGCMNAILIEVVFFGGVALNLWAGGAFR